MNKDIPDWRSEEFLERINALGDDEREKLFDTVRRGEAVDDRRLAPMAVAVARWWRNQRGMRAAREPLVIWALGCFASLLILAFAFTIGPEVGLGVGVAAMAVSLLTVSRLSARARRTVERAERVNRELLG